MKRGIAAALALCLALAPTFAAPALAEEAAAQFRSPAPQKFSAQELQRYGLDARAAQRAVELQRQGYEVRVLSEEEAKQYQAGITDNQWILLGILAGVIVIAVAVSD
jgi:Flp pilus assembly protein TadB